MKIVSNKFLPIIKFLEKYFPFYYYKKCILDGYIIYLPRWVTKDRKQEIDDFVEKFYQNLKEENEEI